MQQASISPTGAGSSSGKGNDALDSSVCISAPSSPAGDTARYGKPESAFKNDRPASLAVGEVPHSAVRCTSSFHSVASWLQLLLVVLPLPLPLLPPPPPLLLVVVVPHDCISRSGFERVHRTMDED